MILKYIRNTRKRGYGFYLICGNILQSIRSRKGCKLIKKVVLLIIAISLHFQYSLNASGFSSSISCFPNVCKTRPFQNLYKISSKPIYSDIFLQVILLETFEFYIVKLSLWKVNCRRLLTNLATSLISV